MFEWRNWEIKTILKKDFPATLKNIKKCPEKLYYRGVWNKQIFDKSLAVVGSRRMTHYGKDVINKFVPDLVSNHFCLISGFMYGVDSEVHRLCVEFGGVTVAVLGFGLDYLSPPENDDLYTKILNNGGLIISEYENNIKGSLWTFPQRNRIVSGLASEGILVIEAGLKSGSLITARLGREQNKNVYAVPGPINSTTSEGTNWLIKENLAKMITNVNDFNIEINSNNQQRLFNFELNKQEEKIYKLLLEEPLTIDEIGKILSISVAEISQQIINLSMKNMVSEEMGKIYITKS